MKTDIFYGFKEKLSQFFESIEGSKFNPNTIKTLYCSSKEDFSIFTNFEVNNDILETLKKLSNDWDLTIENVSYHNSRILITLNRSTSFSNCIELVHSLSTEFGRCDLRTGKKIAFICDEETPTEDFTNYRIKLLTEVAKNLSLAVGFTISENSDQSAHTLYLTHKSNTLKDIEHDKIILCGVVQNAETKIKESTITISEYKKKKNQLLVMEMKDRDKVLENVTDLLTDAVLKFNLLRVKVNSPVLIDFQSHLEGSDSAAIFIMYNYSRLNAIIYEYEDRVEKKYYPSLPPANLVDFSVLIEEKEWNILFNFILQFPYVVRISIENIDDGKFAPHLLYNFLHSMARTVSSYYRSTKILMDNRTQLLPLIFARIYLIKVIHQVFNNGIKLLSIKPVPAV